MDDIERKKKEKEIEEWITLAKSFKLMMYWIVCAISCYEVVGTIDEDDRSLLAEAEGAYLAAFGCIVDFLELVLCLPWAYQRLGIHPDYYEQHLPHSPP